MEILIGREVKQEGLNIRVDQDFQQVGRQHAKIHYREGRLHIEDLETTNGTFINGKRISKKPITEQDVVLLGDKKEESAYKLDIAKLILEIEETLRLQKVDFSKEFADLEIIYKDCKQEIERYKKKAQFKTQMPKIAVSLVIGIFLIIGYTSGWLKGYAEFVYPVILIVMAVIPFLGKKVDSKDAIDLIYEKYEDEYVCPRCHKKLSLQVPWRRHKKNGECPHKCGAKYV